jgi:hypothetical protein
MCRADGGAIAQDIRVAPIANILHSLWDKVTLQVGDKELNQSPDCYNVRAYLTTIMNNTIEAQQERCFAQGLMRDTVLLYDNFIAAENDGFHRRRSCWYHVGVAPAPNAYVLRPFTFCSTLFHDLCQNDRPILWGVPLLFKLSKAPKAFVLGAHTADIGRDFEVRIMKISLRVQIAILSEKQITHIERSLTEKKPALYYYRRFQVAKKPVG